MRSFSFLVVIIKVKLSHLSIKLVLFEKYKGIFFLIINLQTRLFIVFLQKIFII